MNTVKLRTGGINGLRAICSLMIISLTHYGYFPVQNGLPFSGSRFQRGIWYSAQYVVGGFFVISGFVMAYSYRDRIKAEEVNFYSYIKKRLIRFYPMMIFSLLIVVILQLIYSKFSGGGWFAGEIINSNNLLSFVLDVLCMQSMSLTGASFNAPAWFLSAVFIMYVIFYFLTYICRKYNKEDVAYILCIVLGIVVSIRQYPVFLGMILNTRAMIGFFTGCILFRICESFAVSKNKKLRLMINIFAFSFLALIIILNVTLGDVIYGGAPYVISDMVIWPLILFLIINVPFINKILSVRPLLFLGKISMCTYLIHYPVMILAELLNKAFDWNLNYSSETVFLCYIISVLIVGYLCYRFIEKGFARLLKTW